MRSVPDLKYVITSIMMNMRVGQKVLRHVFKKCFFIFITYKSLLLQSKRHRRILSFSGVLIQDQTQDGASSKPVDELHSFEQVSVRGHNMSLRTFCRGAVTFTGETERLQWDVTRFAEILT